MIQYRRPSHPGATRRFAWLVLLTTGVLLQACAKGEGPAGSRLRIYQADLTGAAKSCEVPKIAPVAGATSEAAIKVVNDGGWCGLSVRQDGVKPYDAGLLTARASHGTVLIHEVGDDTRIDYTPDHGFAGNDSFSVKLIPGSTTIRVSMAVSAPGK